MRKYYWNDSGMFFWTLQWTFGLFISWAPVIFWCRTLLFGGNYTRIVTLDFVLTSSWKQHGPSSNRALNCVSYVTYPFILTSYFGSYDATGGAQPKGESQNRSHCLKLRIELILCRRAYLKMSNTSFVWRWKIIFLKKEHKSWVSENT